MNETQAKIYDIDVLERRIAVSDRELAFMLGVGVSTARRIASEANAVCRGGNTQIKRGCFTKKRWGKIFRSRKSGNCGKSITL